MKKIIAVVIVLALAMPVWGSPSFAAPVAKMTSQVIVNVGNKTCPVSGDKVSGKDFVVYKGKRYGLCCPMCEGPFQKNPEKYIAQMKAKERVPVAPKGTVVPINPKSRKMEKAMEQGSL